MVEPSSNDIGNPEIFQIVPGWMSSTRDTNTFFTLFSRELFANSELSFSNLYKLSEYVNKAETVHFTCPGKGNSTGVATIKKESGKP